MEEEYKGYRIVPNSRQLPNGKWLPIAELELHHGGSVTTRPPVQAPQDHIKATKEEADGYAVRMARKWIDERG